MWPVNSRFRSSKRCPLDINGALMLKRLIAWMLAGMLGLAYAGSAFAYFHQWRIHEIYSNRSEERRVGKECRL